MARTLVLNRNYIRQVGGSVVLNGTNQYFDLGTSGPAAQAVTSFTMSCWSKREKITGLSAEFGDNNNSAQNHFNFQQNSARRPLTTVITTSGEKALASPTAVTMNYWTHRILTYDGANITWYIQGVFDSTTTHTGTVLASTAGVLIGTGSAPIGGAYRYFGGNIAELKYWPDRVLNATEVQQIYRGVPDANLWTGLGSSWELATDGNDSVGGNDGTPMNSPTFSVTEVFSAVRDLVSGRQSSVGRQLIT